MKFFALRCEEALAQEALKNFPELQIFNARAIAGEEHIAFAIAQAERAFRSSTNISANKKLEVLLRASAQRQISVAIEKLGIKDSKDVVVISDNLPGELIRRYKCKECRYVLDITPEKLEYLKELFNITERELEATGARGFDEKKEDVKSIIIERIALLNL